MKIRSREEEEYIKALSILFAANDDGAQYPDIVRRIAERALDDNDITWRIWQAARASFLISKGARPWQD